MSGDCDGCAQQTTEVAEVLAALLRRTGGTAVELSAEELGEFTLEHAVVFTRGETGVRVEIREMVSSGGERHG